MRISLSGDLQKSIVESIVDGRGIRLAIFTCGCIHKCKGCHNPSTWNIYNGSFYEVAEVANYIINKLKEGFYNGITLTGGDPMYQEEAVLELIDLIRMELPTLDIWLYTGYYLEEIKDSLVVEKINTIVEGPFILKLKDNKPMRGSSNQNIITLKK